MCGCQHRLHSVVSRLLQIATADRVTYLTFPPISAFVGLAVVIDSNFYVVKIPVHGSDALPVAVFTYISLSAKPCSYTCWRFKFLYINYAKFLSLSLLRARSTAAATVIVPTNVFARRRLLWWHACSIHINLARSARSVYVCTCTETQSGQVQLQLQWRSYVSRRLLCQKGSGRGWWEQGGHMRS